MTEIVKCHICGQKADKDFIIIGPNPENEEEVIYVHKGCLNDNASEVTCIICDKKFKMITPGHLTKHNTTVREYKLRYGPVVSEKQQQRLAAQSRTTRGGDAAELRVQLYGALETIESRDETIEQLNEQIEELREHGSVVEYGNLPVATMENRSGGVVFTMEEIEQIGAVALREMVKLKFGRHESRKEQNIEKLRSLIE